MPVTALAAREASPEGWTDRLVVTYHDEQGGALPLGMRALRGGARHVVVDLGRPAVPSDLRRFNDPSILRVEPDRKKFVLETPSDPGYENQWGTSDAGAGASDFSVRAEAAWDLTTGSALLTVAVLDTGITTHTEFSGRLVPGYDFIDDVDVANDGGGRDSDPSDPGDWITVGEDASGYFEGCGAGDSSWHGTHVAGTIGAAANNAVGIAGLNWNSKIQPIRVLGKCGGYDSDIADAIYWAAGGSIDGVPANSNPAKVINLSLGGFGPCSGFLQDAIDGARALGAIVVVAAGNSNSDASLFSPANCDGVITVAATSRDGKRSYYSNFGSAVEIAAPGGDAYEDSMILSTINLGATTPGAQGYAYYQGTSMAAPHVAGVISLLLSLDATLTEAEVLQLVEETATPFPAGTGANPCSTAENCGAGIINAADLMAAASPVVAPAVLTDASFLAAPEVGEAVSISEGTWSGTRGTAFTYSWYQCTRSGEATSVSRGRAPSRCSRIRDAEAVTYTPVSRTAHSLLKRGCT
jgi:serine protease